MTQVPRPSQRPVDTPVVPGDASTPDSPAAASTAPKAVRPVHRLAVALQQEAELEFLRDDDLDSWEAIAERILSDPELLDALVAYRQPPLGYVILTTHISTRAIMGIDSVLPTLTEAQAALDRRERNAAANPEWTKGIRHIISELRPLPGESNAD